jgi:hypothetical protein
LLINLIVDDAIRQYDLRYTTNYKLFAHCIFCCRNLGTFLLISYYFGKIPSLTGLWLLLGEVHKAGYINHRTAAAGHDLWQNAIPLRQEEIL